MKIHRIIKRHGKIEQTHVDAPEPVYNVRIRPELYEPLVTIAAREKRSITAHINYVLEQYLAGKVE